MDINNIALVRVTNVIPFDGVVKCISNSPYLCKKTGTDLSFIINDILSEEGLLPQMDFSRIDEENYYDEFVKQKSTIIKSYLPFVSDYNSMVLFSLNGMVPDDSENGFGNNTFSNKKCAIIEPLKYHIDKTVSLMPTDTAIKGDVTLSKEAVIFIDKATYEQLPLERKEQLKSLNVLLFEGELKQVIFNYLKGTSQYVPETLSLTRENKGFIPSSTSQQQIENIESIARQHNIAQVLFYNILTGQNDEQSKLESVKDEFEKSQYVTDEYTIMFLEKLLVAINASEDVISCLRTYLYDKQYLNLIKQLIKDFGIENYKNFVDKYNEQLLEMQKNGTLPTPEDIIKKGNLNKEETK